MKKFDQDYLNAYLLSEQQFGCAIQEAENALHLGKTDSVITPFYRWLQNAAEQTHPERAEIIWRYAEALKSGHYSPLYTILDLGQESLTEVLMEYAFLRADPLDPVFQQRLFASAPNFLPRHALQHAPNAADALYQQSLVLNTTTNGIDLKNVHHLFRHHDEVKVIRAWSAARKLKPKYFHRADIIGKRTILASPSDNEQVLQRQLQSEQNLSDSSLFKAVWNTIEKDPLPYFSAPDQATQDLAEACRQTPINMTYLKQMIKQQIPHLQNESNLAPNDLIHFCKEYYAPILTPEMARSRVVQRSETLQKVKLLWQAINANPCNATYHDSMATLQDQFGHAFSSTLHTLRAQHIRAAQGSVQTPCSIDQIARWNQTDYALLRRQITASLNLSQYLDWSQNTYRQCVAELPHDSIAQELHPQIVKQVWLRQHPELAPETWGQIAQAGGVGALFGFTTRLSAHLIDRLIRKIPRLSPQDAERLAVFVNVTLLWQLGMMPTSTLSLCAMYVSGALAHQLTQNLNIGYTTAIHLGGSLLQHYIMDDIRTFQPWALMASSMGAGVASWGLNVSLTHAPTIQNIPQKPLVTPHKLIQLTALPHHPLQPPPKGWPTAEVATEHQDEARPCGLFDTIPNEILITNIFYYLSFRDMMTLSLTSYSFHRYVTMCLQTGSLSKLYDDWLQHLGSELAVGILPIRHSLSPRIMNKLICLHDHHRPYHQRIQKRQGEFDANNFEMPFRQVLKYGAPALILTIYVACILAENIAALFVEHPESIQAIHTLFADFLDNHSAVMFFIVTLSALGFEFGDSLWSIHDFEKESTLYETLSTHFKDSEIAIETLRQSAHSAANTIALSKKLSFFIGRQVVSESAESVIKGIENFVETKDREYAIEINTVEYAQMKKHS